MSGTFPVVSLFLLQAPPLSDFALQDNPIQAILVLAGIVVVAVVATTISKFRNRMSSSISGKGKSNIRAPLTPRRFNFFTLHRIASAYGLNREQTKLLEYVFRNDAVTDPQRVMNNPALVDQHFKRTYREIERTSETEAEAQHRMAKLFSLRDTIEFAVCSSNVSPPRLSENTPTVLLLNKDSYHVKVISSQGRNVIVEAPRNLLGTLVRVAKGTEVVLSFFTKSSDGFSLAGHAAGAVDTHRGQGLQISHSGKVKPLVKRMYRRKKVSAKAEVSFVNLEGAGGKKRDQKIVVGTKKFSGTVLDISNGGCALKVSAPIPAGARLKISIDHTSDHFINVLGEVLRINKSESVRTILHIKFLKVPLRAFNSISALVYGYRDMWDS